MLAFNDHCQSPAYPDAFARAAFMILSPQHHAGRGGLTLAALLCLMLSGCQPDNQYAPPDDPQVTVAKPLVQTVYDYLEETGSTEAVELVQIRARVRGFIEQINFEPGQDVVGDPDVYKDVGLSEIEATLPKTGQGTPPSDAPPADGANQDDLATDTSTEGQDKAKVLYVIEKQVYEAEVNKAKAALEVAKAEFLNADVRLRRAIPLADRNVITKEELDERRAERAVAEAKVKASIAELNEKKINLNYCDVRSPISGPCR